jgi:hypothetical protein
VVAGDFNGDGKDDVAALYDYGGTVASWHVWLSTGTAFELQAGGGWWSSSEYAAYQATDRIVAGDFDGDGQDDVAAMYTYGVVEQHWHVWLSTGDSFDYQGNDGWWSYGAYGSADITRGRVVAGDFDGDDRDDVAAMWQLEGLAARWHVWYSNGTAFEYQGVNGAWSSGQYLASLTTHRVVAGDFSGNGKDDVAAMYEYPENKTAWHVWLPTGDAFEYQGNDGWWWATGYAAYQATDRVVAGDFDGDTIADVAAMYDYGGNVLHWHVWLSNAPNLVFLPFAQR